MAKHAQTVFKFTFGGFFDGYWELDIFESGDGYHATYSNTHHRDIAAREFPVSEEQIERLWAKLDTLGVSKWFCNYFNPFILDGI